MIPVENLPDVLPIVLPMLEKTLEIYGYNRYSLEEIVYGLRMGLYTLWAGQEEESYIFLITELRQEKSGLVVNVILGGGALDSEDLIIQHIELLEQWAKGIGAVGISVWGRLGWKKKLAPYGYQHETSLFRRVFSERMN